MQRTINPRVLEILKEYNVNVQNGLAYLLTLHYDLTPNCIPTPLIANVQTTRIVEKALDNTGLKWNIPLFVGEVTEYDWVKTEYVEIFKAKNSTKGGKVAPSIIRLKKFFADNQSYSKADVLGATELYVSSTDARYLMDPHYFITKGKGIERTSTLFDWIEKFVELEEASGGRTSHANTMNS